MRITHCRGDGGVSHEFLRGCQINTGRFRARAERMAEIVEPEVWLYFRLPHGNVMATVDVVRRVIRVRPVREQVRAL